MGPDTSFELRGNGYFILEVTEILVLVHVDLFGMKVVLPISGAVVAGYFNNDLTGA